MLDAPFAAKDCFSKGRLGRRELMSHQVPSVLREGPTRSALQASTPALALPPALFEATGQALEAGQADLESAGGLSAALGLGNEHFLAHIQRSVQESGGPAQGDISSILAASIGVPPVCLSAHRSFATLLRFSPGPAGAPFTHHKCRKVLVRTRVQSSPAPIAPGCKQSEVHAG